MACCSSLRVVPTRWSRSDLIRAVNGSFCGLHLGEMRQLPVGNEQANGACTVAAS
jgi:hypothetical protein